jgi:hypothetical protein
MMHNTATHYSTHGLALAASERATAETGQPHTTQHRPERHDFVVVPKGMTPQDHASHLLRQWQERRHLKPIYRLADIDSYERDLRKVNAPGRVTEVARHG